MVKLLPRPLLIKLSYVFRKPVALFFKGNSVECNVCGKSFRKFLPYGYNEFASDNRLCPYCLSLERHRLLWVYLNKKTNFFTDNLKVLHIAPEQPYLKKFKSLKNIEYTTADLYSPIADVKTDIRDLVFDDDSFDVIICNHVLEHIDQEQKAMKELLRVMKPGAWAILQVPIDYSKTETYEDLSITDPKLRQKHFGQYDHVRLYGTDYSQRLRKAGFKVTEDNYVSNFDKKEQERYRFDKNEIIYLCKK